MAGGTFTMCVYRVDSSAEGLLLIEFADSSNGGVFGSLYGTPIINLPQSAVLGAWLGSASRGPHKLSEMGNLKQQGCTQRRIDLLL